MKKNTKCSLLGDAGDIGALDHPESIPVSYLVRELNAFI